MGDFFFEKLFFKYFDLKNGCKNDFEGNCEKSVTDPVIGFPTKSILNPFGLTSPIRQRES